MNIVKVNFSRRRPRRVEQTVDVKLPILGNPLSVDECIPGEKIGILQLRDEKNPTLAVCMFVWVI